MNMFKRKSLHAAVLAGLGAVGVAGTANAVHINPDGLGSVLIYPYYTTRADGGGTSTAYYDNLISIVNTTNSTKAVKVRFLENKRSAEVLDFNLFLSPRDVWTGAIVRTANGAGLISRDRSCVVPNDLFAKTTPATILDGDKNHFKNFVYAATDDGGGATLDRTREGYLEVFEMGDVTNTTATAAAKHNSAGVPANCAYFETFNTNLSSQLSTPTGGLLGSASLINVTAGTDYSYDAVALANWNNGAIYSAAGDVTPRLTDGNVTSSTVFTAGGNVVTTNWTSGRDAVSATMMRQYIFNEFMMEAGTNSGTDWVVTFPTKFAYSRPVTTASAADAPFNANFRGGQACDIYDFAFWNREEGTASTPSVILPSPPPPVTPTVNSLCFEANVLTFNGSNILGAANPYAVTIPDSVGRTGWASIGFLQAVQVLTPPAPGQVHRGLPAVGFAVQDFNNGNVGGVASNFGGLHVHKYFRSIGTTP